MGLTYSDTIRREAIQLRKLGKSYGDIRKTLNIKSKGTLSLWFKGLKLSSIEHKRLEHNKLLAQQRGLLNFNRERTKLIQAENKNQIENGRGSIKEISRNDLLLVGAALYWGEGTKSEGHGPYITFSNSDPKMVSIFMRFIREILEVKEEKIRAGIQIHPNIKESTARIFWSRITKLPADRFYITKQISITSKLRRPKRSLQFGTVAIRVNNRILFYRIKGYIEGLARQA
jgi:hypothetical protein